MQKEMVTVKLENELDIMEEIVTRYRKGTDFDICMEEDGLIRAGRGYEIGRASCRERVCQLV